MAAPTRRRPARTRLSAPDRRLPSHGSAGGAIPDARRGGRLPLVHLGYRRALPPELNELVHGDDRGCDERHDQPNHLALARAIQAFLRWRNTHNRDPELIAAQRRERTRVRSERHQRWGRPRPPPGP